MANTEGSPLTDTPRRVKRDTACMVLGLVWLLVAVGAQVAGDEVMMAAALVASQVWIVASWQ